MIERYSREQMKKVWSDENRFQKWLDVEVALAEAQAEAGVIPNAAPKAFKSAKIKLKRISEIEAQTHHDVIAFTTSVSEQAGEMGRFLHYGITSSDVVDTALSLMIQESGQILLEDCQGVMDSLKNLALRTKDLLGIGRSHGIHAEPTSFGLRFVSFYEEMSRNKNRLEQALEQLRYGQFSGAVGNYTTTTPAIEEQACKRLGLKPEVVGTQVIPRDRHAEFFWAAAVTASGIERIATELRHLQRTEVLEVEEGFKKGQKGSSAMPHKKNPISGENLTGCARLLRAALIPALENVPLWHERDISHSSVERVQFPDVCILMDYALNRLKGLLDGLVIKEENITKNLDHLKGLALSGVLLSDLVKKGVSREEAYASIQKAAHNAWDQGVDFLSEFQKVPLSAKVFQGEELKKQYSPERFKRHVDTIYQRVFSSGKS